MFSVSKRQDEPAEKVEITIPEKESISPQDIQIQPVFGQYVKIQAFIDRDQKKLKKVFFRFLKWYLRVNLILQLKTETTSLHGCRSYWARWKKTCYRAMLKVLCDFQVWK